jgi:hypothetical protein
MSIFFLFNFITDYYSNVESFCFIFYKTFNENVTVNIFYFSTNEVILLKFKIYIQTYVTDCHYRNRRKTF